MIETELRTRLESKLLEINKVLDERPAPQPHIGILAGLSGLAVFKFYYARYTGNRALEDDGEELLNEAFEMINNEYAVPTFCSGIAGAGWALEHLSDEDFIEIDTDELLSALDVYLYQMMYLEAEEFYYDFLHGALGIAFFFLKRYENTSSETLRETYHDYLNQVLDTLEKQAIVEGTTAKWRSVTDREKKTRGFNLGLSHGMSSIINFLSRLNRQEAFTHRAEPLLSKAVNFIISMENIDPDPKYYFPDFVEKDDEIRSSGRLAWCYGDVGIAISLWHAARSLGKEGLEKKSLDVLKHTTRLRSQEETAVSDVGICHGAAGMMHIYQFLFRETAIREFREAADYWAGKTLDMAVHENGYAGYSQRNQLSETGWSSETGILEGIAGIGLSIMSYLAPGYDKWNQALLIG